MSDTAWLQSLKVGDEVLLWNDWMTLEHRLWRPRVERATKTQVVVDGTKYSRRTGRPVGSDYWRDPRIVQPSKENIQMYEERLAELEDERFRNVTLARLRLIGRHDLSLDQLRRIVAILDEPKGGEE